MELSLSWLQFYSKIMGGAQKLKNGNTLITLSLLGKVVEVTPDKKTIWKYDNPFDLYGEERAASHRAVFKGYQIE